YANDKKYVLITDNLAPAWELARKAGYQILDENGSSVRDSSFDPPTGNMSAAPTAPNLLTPEAPGTLNPESGEIETLNGQPYTGPQYGDQGGASNGGSSFNID